jgi:ketosteroid isomerase-like protein
MIRRGIGALAALILVGTAHAATSSPTEIVQRHMAAGAKGDVAGITADYADDAVVLQSGTALQGKPAIHAFFERLFPPRPAGTPPPPGPAFTVTKVWQDGNVGFATWTMGDRSGTDEFIVVDGKIKVQAVFIGAPPAPPPQ